MSKKTKIYRVYQQDIGNTTFKEFQADVAANGAKVEQASASVFGGCWFVQISGNYIGKLKIHETTLAPNIFD